MNPSILNRLIASRHLLETAGPELTSVSDPLVVAQRLLIAHDAAELALWALSVHVNAPVLGKNGEVVTNPSFVALGEAILKHLNCSHEPQGKPLALLQEVNRLRVAFKHHGDLPNVPSTFHLPANLVELLNDWCYKAAGITLMEIDHLSSILEPELREGFLKARTLLAREHFKEAMEQTAATLSDAFLKTSSWELVDSALSAAERALVLSGRGVACPIFCTS
jgi:hypothetical protein